MKIIEKKELEIGNRDGGLNLVHAADGKFYLVLEADTLHRKETFDGLGSTENLEISEAAYLALRDKA